MARKKDRSRHSFAVYDRQHRFGPGCFKFLVAAHPSRSVTAQASPLPKVRTQP